MKAVEIMDVYKKKFKNFLKQSRNRIHKTQYAPTRKSPSQNLEKLLCKIINLAIKF